MTPVRPSALRVASLFALLLPAAASVSAAQRRPSEGTSPATSAAPRFQWIGPQPAGRIASVAGVPGDTSTYYLGAASGGVWKTTDGGHTFAPIFDDQPVQAIGALAVASSNARIVWAGTGEAWAIRDGDVMGDGVYRSLDGGVTWRNMGLRETGRIGRIVVHPTNPDIVYVCALGRTSGPQEERGVYRTTDAGEHWQRVLFVNPDTGCSGLAMDANDPKVLFAGTWEVVMHTWAMFSGGGGSGVYVTRDSGSTWTRIVHPGLPKSPVGKIDVAVAPSNSKRIFALIQTPDQGSLWRSDDGGESWAAVSWDRRLTGRAGYYIRVSVNPMNDNEVLVASSSLLRSFDGGATFPATERGCGDCHDIWMDPRNPSHWVLTGDGGAGITRNHGQSYFNLTLPIGQMYHLAIDNRVPYWVYSNRQDDGTMRGPNDAPIAVPNVPSFSRTGGPAFDDFGGPTGNAASWQPGLGGCESGFTIPVPSNPDIVWATCYGATVTRYDARQGRARHVSPGIHTLDSAPNELKYRCHWTPPLAIDPFDHNAVYFGCQVIFKTVNGGQSWTVISPDLSTKDSSRIVSSGGIVGDNLGQFYGEVVFAIAPSEIQKGLLWAGTNDGQIWNTKDGGTTWNNLTKNVTGMPGWGIIRRIEPSRFDPATAYVAVDYHLMDERNPHLFRTTDYGKTWTTISGGLPNGHPLDYVLTVAENPNRKGMLFVGTGHAFYYSIDDGWHWTQYKEGLPAAPVTWIVVSKPTHDVALSTYGRGLYVMHDITTLEQQDKVAADAAVHFFEPRPGIRLARNGSADFNVQLRAAPKDSLKLEIMDSTGTVVRTMKSIGREGIGRLTWDLRYDAPKQVELRTIPPDNPHIWEEARFKNGKPRPVIHWGIEGPQRAGPLASGGRYTARLTADGTALMQPFSVLRDPSLPSSDADLALSTRTQTRIRDDINAAAEMINRLESMRRQLEEQGKSTDPASDVGTSLAQLAQRMMDVELLLLSRSDLHSDDKWYVEKYRVYMNLVWLNGEVGTGAGDVQGGAEYRPTDASLATLADVEKDLAAAKAAFTKLLDTDVKAFNEAMTGKAKVIMDQ